MSQINEMTETNNTKHRTAHKNNIFCCKHARPQHLILFWLSCTEIKSENATHVCKIYGFVRLSKCLFLLQLLNDKNNLTS